MLESRKQLSALGALLAQALVALVLLLGAGIPALAQQGQAAQPGQGQPAQGQPAPGDLTQPPAAAPNPASQNGAPPQQLPPDTVRPNYILGPNDQILIRAPEAEELDNRPFRIDGDGNISLPLIGRIHAAGMSLQELEADMFKRLREYIREPQVFVTVVQFRSEPVFFVGLFVKPGIYPLQGNRTLMEMLSSG